VIPVITEFDPTYILVSCGFDSARGDSFGGLDLTQAGYASMLQKLMGFNKKILLVLEGGYCK
jgi:histone deacetylase 6